MNQSIVRIITGIIVLGIGAGALLDALNIFSFWEHFQTWWPLLIIGAGVLTLIGNPRSNYVWALALILIGGLLQLNRLDLTEVNIFALIWPIIIIAVGLSILTNFSSRKKVTKGKDVDNISAVLSGSDTVSTSKNYKGGRITAVMGGAVLDLRDAQIKDEAVLDIFALCGGVEIKVPREWRVQSQATMILGGIENKTTTRNSESGPVLTITGTVALGGIEVNS